MRRSLSNPHPRRLQTDKIWAVTGTPFTTSLGQLAKQGSFLGQDAIVNEIVLGKPLGRYQHEPLSNEEVVSRLRKLMMRHTKVRPRLSPRH